MKIGKHMEISILSPLLITGTRAQTVQIAFEIAAEIEPDEDFPRGEMEAAINALEQRFLKLKDTGMPRLLKEYNEEAAAAKDLFGPID